MAEEEQGKENLIDGNKEIDVVNIYMLAETMISNHVEKVSIGRFIDIIDRAERRAEELIKENGEFICLIRAIFGAR